MPVSIKAQEEGVGGQHQGKFQGTAPGKVSEDISRESFRGERQEKFQRAVPGKMLSGKMERALARENISGWISALTRESLLFIQMKTGL